MAAGFLCSELNSHYPACLNYVRKSFAMREVSSWRHSISQNYASPESKKLSYKTTIHVRGKAPCAGSTIICAIPKRNCAALWKAKRSTSRWMYERFLPLR